MLVRPQARPLPVENSTFSIGGPGGSMAILPFTSLGRASAISQLKYPAWEWVIRIAGPILSSSAAPAA
jgi:hypothetical protein